MQVIDVIERTRPGDTVCYWDTSDPAKSRFREGIAESVENQPLALGCVTLTDGTIVNPGAIIRVMRPVKQTYFNAFKRWLENGGKR